MTTNRRRRELQAAIKAIVLERVRDAETWKGATAPRAFFGYLGRRFKLNPLP
jgi:PII-like signaling protein